MRKCLYLALSFTFALLLLSAAEVSAQTSGEITGLVTDPSGAAVAGATVTVTNKATGATRISATNSEGFYAFPSLLPGVYELKIERQGFKTAQLDNITLEVQQTARRDVTMEVGAVGETVTITSVGALLNAENTTVGTVIENKRIVDLPLNGRNFLQLVATAPNVSFGFQNAGQAGSRQGGTRSQQNISVAGQRSYFNRFTIDGVENTDVNFNTPIILPSIDALQEFKVQTGIFPAEFGRASTQINISTKSGTREYHGTLFEFIRNDVFDAHSYAFTPTQARSPKEAFKWNQYGFTLGGPVWLPKKLFGPLGYENKERIFFMTNFEGFRDRKTQLRSYPLPPAAWRDGDFSQLSNPIFDPLTRQQFAGNIIPKNRLHPTSLKLLEFYPAPNVGPNALGDNHEQSQKRFIDKDQFIGRGDFIESASSNWAGRYSWGDEVQIEPGLKLNGTKLLTTVKQVMASNTRTFGASKVNEARFGYNSFFNSLGRELAGVRDVVGELKIPGVESGPPIAWGIPSIAISGGFAGFGDDSEGPYVNTNSTYQFVDNFSWTVGSHSFRFGGEIRWDQYNQVGNQFARGAFLFEPNATTNPGVAGTGNSFADFLLGYCKRCEVSVSLAQAQFRAFSQSFYFDDTWKLTPKLTLNLGLRYEYTPPWFDETGRLVNIFVPFFDNTPNVADKSRHPVFIRTGSGDFYEGLALRFNPAIQVARDGRMGKRLVDDDRNDFAPRFGLAYSPTSKWTVRLGGGVFHSQDTGNPRFDMARNLAGRRRDEATPTLIDLNWNAPFRSLGSSVVVSNPYVLGNIFARRTPYVLQYMLNVQRELGGNMLVEVGYLGSLGRKLESLRAFNEAIPGTVGSTTDRSPYPEFSRIQEVDGSGKSSYNSVSLKLEKRFSAGLSFLTGYTFSKSIDNASAIRSHGGDTLFPQNSYNLAAEKALSSFHTSHRFVGSATYELPFGAGKRLFDRGGIVNVLLGGWQISPIVAIQTGFPLTVTTGRDQALTGGGFDRPINKAGQNAVLPRDQRTIDRWFNTDAFVIQPRGAFGNVGRNTIISPGIIQVDAALIKNFRFTESKSLQFRFEAFNAPNHPNWGNPGTGAPKEERLNADGTITVIPANANFGRITGMRGTMRELQFGLKLYF